MQLQKYHYRLRDLYASQASNRVVLLPDWRIRSDDKQPKFELFAGDLAVKHRKKEYDKRVNADTLPITDFILHCKQPQIIKYVK